MIILKNYISSYLFLILISIISIYGCNENSLEPSNSFSAEYSQIDFEPSWSFDGKKIAYTHSNPDIELSGIYIIDSNGNNKTQLISGFATSSNWSPDGNWIVFSHGEQIFKIKTNKDSLQQLTFEGKNFFPKWSIEGDLIIYSNINCSNLQCGIWIMKANGGEKRLIDANGNYPDWTGVSSSLIYFKASKNLDGTFDGDSLFQFSIQTNTKNLITILNGENHKFNSYPNYSSDKIILNSTSNTGFSYLYKLNLTGLSLMKLTNTQTWSPNLSPDNRSIIYTNRNPGNGRLWKMNSDGSNSRQLTF